MKCCPQTDTQSVYQHGISVRNHTFELITALRNKQSLPNWRLPDWLIQYRDKTLENLLPDSIIDEYTKYHDCSKPYCLTIDLDGKRHFPDHAEKSFEIWSQVGTPQAAKLMRMDMLVHKLKADEVDQFIQHPEAITLLIVGLAEIHSNATMFGGIGSDSFKIKWKQLNKRGKQICNKLFQGE